MLKKIMRMLMARLKRKMMVKVLRLKKFPSMSQISSQTTKRNEPMKIFQERPSPMRLLPSRSRKQVDSNSREKTV